MRTPSEWNSPRLWRSFKTPQKTFQETSAIIWQKSPKPLPLKFCSSFLRRQAFLPPCIVTFYFWTNGLLTYCTKPSNLTSSLITNVLKFWQSNPFLFFSNLKFISRYFGLKAFFFQSFVSFHLNQMKERIIFLCFFIQLRVIKCQKKNMCFVFFLFFYYCVIHKCLNCWWCEWRSQLTWPHSSSSSGQHCFKKMDDTMAMYFDTGTQVTLLFKTWRAETIPQFLGTLVRCSSFFVRRLNWNIPLSAHCHVCRVCVRSHQVLETPRLASGLGEHPPRGKTCSQNFKCKNLRRICVTAPSTPPIPSSHSRCPSDPHLPLDAHRHVF